MNYWNKYTKFNNKIIDAYEQLDEDKLVLVDGGAAGDLSLPFKTAARIIKAIRFEPRGESEILLKDSDIHVNGGLWSEDCSMELFIANEPTASSICPPNIAFLEQFEDAYGSSARQSIGKALVQLRSIDSCVSENEIPLPNFIKLDIHSAELPALIGSKRSLSKCVGLLVETWNSEVHIGQGLHCEVEKFAIENGFEVFDNICAARWQIKHNGKISQVDRGRYIGSEILFIKSVVPDELKIKKAIILAIFGFYNEAKNELLSVGMKDDSILYRAVDKVQRSIARSPSFLLRHFLKRVMNRFS